MTIGFDNVPPSVITLSEDLVLHGVQPHLEDSDKSSKEGLVVNFATMHDCAWYRGMV